MFNYDDPKVAHIRRSIEEHRCEFDDQATVITEQQRATDRAWITEFLVFAEADFNRRRRINPSLSTTCQGCNGTAQFSCGGQDVCLTCAASYAAFLHDSPEFTNELVINRVLMDDTWQVEMDAALDTFHYGPKGVLR